MPFPNYDFEYYDDLNTVWVDINGFQSYTVNIGRQFQLDTYRADTAEIVCLYYWDDQYETILKPGVKVRLRDDSRGVVLYAGIIKDLKVDYGIPFYQVGGVDYGPADRMTVSCESSFAFYGRMSGDGYSMTANNLDAQLDAAETETGTTILRPADALTTQMGATTISGTWGDWINRVCLTLNNRLRQTETIEIVSKYSLPTTTVAFAEGGGPLLQTYGQIDFTSLADNFYTQIVVKPEGFAEAISTTGVAPFRTYVVNTLNASTSQAQDYADYLLANYSLGSAQLASLSATSAQQDPDFELDILGTKPLSSDGYTQNLIGYQLNVTFRGLAIAAIIEGLRCSGDPDNQRYTYFFSGVDLNAYLILDDATFGKLDENKLGY